jgi:hypothetical protein
MRAAMGHRKWCGGAQRGSVYLADQKLPIQVPRVRNRQAGVEVPLQSYHRLQQPRAADEGMLRRILYGLSCRDYRAAAEAVPEACGLSRSSVSRRYVPATARRPQALQKRRLDQYDLVALVLVGKTFADDTGPAGLAGQLITLGQKVLAVYYSPRGALENPLTSGYPPPPSACTPVHLGGVGQWATQFSYQQHSIWPTANPP